MQSDAAVPLASMPESSEEGGLFTALRERHSAAEITEVTRQRIAQ